MVASIFSPSNTATLRVDYMVQMSPLPPASASHYLLMLVMFFAFIIIIAIIIIVIILNFSLYVRNYTLIKQSMIFFVYDIIFVCVRLLLLLFLFIRK